MHALPGAPAIAALDAWATGPIGTDATPEQLAAAGAAVRLPLVAGPLLAAAAALLPAAAFGAWPLEAMGRYYRQATSLPDNRLGVQWTARDVRPSRLNELALYAINGQHLVSSSRACTPRARHAHIHCSASLSERYKMTHTLLEADAHIPWSAVRRPRAAADGLAAVSAPARLSQLRRLYEDTAGWLAGGAGVSGVPRLELGAATFGGLCWRVALVCCPVTADVGENGTASGGRHTDAELRAGPLRWRLGLQVAAAPLLGRWSWSEGGSNEQRGNSSAPVQCGRSHPLYEVGAAKAAAAAQQNRPHHTMHLQEDGGAQPVSVADAALHLTVGICADVGEHAGALQRAAALVPLLLSESCCDSAYGESRGPHPWCLRGGACGFCRRGALPAALPHEGNRGGGAEDRTALFVGWQPERWSALAPGGQLYWHCTLRVVTDY